MDGNLAHLRPENISFYADEIAYVEKFFENCVVKFGVSLVGANRIAGYVNLNTPCRILYFGKRRLAHNAPAHNATGYADLPFLIFITESGLNPVGVRIDRKLIRRIRVNTQPA